MRLNKGAHETGILDFHLICVKILLCTTSEQVHMMRAGAVFSRLSSDYFYVCNCHARPFSPSHTPTSIMNILKTFLLDDTEHIVRIIPEEDDVLFSASDVGNLLGIKKVRNSLTGFDADQKVKRSVSTTGGEQDATFLTQEGVLKLVMKSNKSIATALQKWVFKVVKEISEKGRYELKRKFEDELAHEKDRMDETAHKAAVIGADRRRIVYFGKIKTMDGGSCLIKIGCTDDIKQRAVSLAWEFGQMSIINTFECDYNAAFERDMHQKLRKYKYTDVINGKKPSTEVFKLLPAQLKTAVNIALRNVNRFRKSVKQTDMDDIIASNPYVKRLCLHAGIKEPDVATKDSDRGHCTVIGRKVQKYSLDTTDLLETYSRISDVSRGNGSRKYSTSGVERACKLQSEYKGHRWAYLDRELADDTVQDIGATQVVRSNRMDLVAALCPMRKAVVRVYANFKQLSICEGFESDAASWKRAKKNKPLDDGRHIVRWRDVAEDLQQAWLASNTLPRLPINADSKTIFRLDKDTLDVIQKYDCINDAKRDFKFANRTLHSAIAGNTVLRNFKWSYGA